MVSSFAGGFAGSVVGQAVIEVVVDNSGVAKSLTNTQKMVAALAVAGLGKATVQALAYETALAGVAKTTNLTGKPLQALGKEFRALATREIPMTAVQLANIGATAAQLGVKADDLVHFTETVAKLGVATNIVGEQGAQDLARFINVMGDSTERVGNIGSAIVDLGNNSATTEAEILALALRTAAAGRQMGLTTGEVLGMATAASSLGLEAEAGGTALSRVMLDIYANAQKGSGALALHAQVAGMTAEAYQRMVHESPMEALTAFIGGLATAEKRGINVITMLDEMSFGNVRVRDALLRLSGSQELMTASVERGNRAYHENIALQEEFELFADTGANKLRILANQFTEVGITAGSVMVPALKVTIGVLSMLVAGFSELSPEVQLAVLAFLAFIALRVPLTLLFAKIKAGALASATSMRALWAAASARNLAAIGTALGPGGIAGALLAVGVAADAIMRKTTNHGLIDWLFRDPKTADHVANSLKNVETRLRAIERAGGEASALTEHTREIDGLVRRWQAAADQIDRIKDMSANQPYRVELERQTKAIKAQIQALIDAKVPFADIKKLVEGLPAPLRAAIEEMDDYRATLDVLARNADVAEFKRHVDAYRGSVATTATTTDQLADSLHAARAELRGMTPELMAAKYAADLLSASLGGASDIDMEVLRSQFIGQLRSDLEAQGRAADEIESLLKAAGYDFGKTEKTKTPSTPMERMLDQFEVFGARAPKAMAAARVELAMYRAAAVRANDEGTVKMIDGLLRLDPTVSDLRSAISSLQAQYGDLSAAAEEARRRMADAMQEARDAAVSSVDTLGRAITTALQRQYAESRDETLKYLKAQRDDYTDAHNSRMAQIQRERDAAIAVIDDQIAALRKVGTDNRLRDLRMELQTAWDPIERKRIQDQIADIEREITIAQLEEAKRGIEADARLREEAERADFARQSEHYDRLEQDARDTYDRMTEAWRLEAKARELITKGEMGAINDLLTKYLGEEWPTLFQSFSESVINGPLTNLENKLKGLFGLLGQGGGAFGGAGIAVVNPNAEKIASLNATGQAMAAAGANPGLLKLQREGVINLGGIPTFKQGGALFEPALILAGDRPGTFEHVTGDDQLRRSIRDEFARAGDREIVIHNYTVLDGEVIDHRVERVLDDQTGRGAFGWGASRRGGA